ncbi:MAG: vWA domain-containing protein [Halomonas sp.]|uniref:vWA domain-containing protein n=1 Tax=Halomonas sp. TaxID=1486246 RepID=UPI0028702496|nr:vWA domain-containing protein [Halomonas sp.]MDR9439402.1 vWA domain-containing protein [Halomonas sp.]
MPRLSRTFFLLPAALLLGATPAIAERVGVMVLDASGSMWNRMDGDITRIEVARDVIDEYLQGRDPEVPLSVLAYGHNRRGDCGDIEVIAAMELQDADTLADRIRALNPQGMTPIADSLRLAAEQIPRTAEAADIILVTDGLETCEGDPCAEAARLAEKGLAIRAHVVGFGLTDSEIQQLSCVTEQTGGELFQTNSGAELARALSQVEQAAAEPVAEPEPEPMPAAELTAPDEAPAGSVIEVAWTGPDDDRDYVTIVEAGAPEGSHTDYTRTRHGSPLTITAPDALGNHEIRYVLQQSGRTLARQPVTLTPASASVTAPEEAVTGSVIEVDWQGPDNPRDYITIVEAGAPEGSHTDYTRTRHGSPLTITAPDALGNHEIRYVLQQSGRTLARQPISLIPATAQLMVNEPILPSGEFQVEWTGPDNPRDYITIVEAGAPEGSHTDYTRTSHGSPVTLDAPEEPGDYEVRYVIQQSGRTLASVPVSVGAGEISLAIEGTPEAGGVVTVNWQGPGRYEDFIQIVEVGSPADDDAIREARASQGSPVQLFAPSTAGDYEVRYKASDSGEVLERITFSVE